MPKRSRSAAAPLPIAYRPPYPTDYLLRGLSADLDATTEAEATDPHG